MKLRLKSVIKTGDVDFAEVLRHSAFAFIILIAATGIQFTFDLLLAQRFGAHGYGVFYLGFSLLMTLALIGRLGLDRAVIRFMPDLIRQKQTHLARGLTNTVVRLSLYFTIPVSIILFIGSDFLANNVFNVPELNNYLKTFAFAIPPFALSYIYSGVLRGLKHTTSSLFLERISIYAIGIIAILTSSVLYGLEGVVIGFTFACFITAILGSILVRRHLTSPHQAQPFNKSRLLMVAGPLLFVTFATQMNGQASVLLLGIFSSASDVGIFNIALKISMLMSLILAAITVITATKISELYHAKKYKELSTLLSKTSALGALWGLPLLLSIITFPTFLLGLFGNEFTVGVWPLIILGIGQFVNVSVGSTIFALGMTNHERSLAVTMAVALFGNLILGIILIPRIGVIGASIATSLTIVISNLVLVMLVKKYLNAWLLPYAGIRSWMSTLIERK